MSTESTTLGSRFRGNDGIFIAAAPRLSFPRTRESSDMSTESTTLGSRFRGNDGIFIAAAPRLSFPRTRESSDVELNDHMRYLSTRGGMSPATFSDILLEGLAPD